MASAVENTVVRGTVTSIAALCCAVQFLLQVGPLVGEMLFAQVDDLMVGAPVAFRLVHRLVRVVEDLFAELVAAT